MGLIAWLVVGAIAGWIAGKLVPGDEGYGVIGTIIAGIIGGFVGGWLLALLTNKEDWMTGIDITTLIAAIVGAVIVVVVWQMLTGRRSRAA
ncbi:MAG TPA: GlsB/YeaQ/YmgE family stress response membrane protein [Candidatus Limnocylindria bacterium]|nr:GlsB/YeaQ/YmgE family stress response membrane protein [Candidatus Limnocylindria bacterium]